MTALTSTREVGQPAAGEPQGSTDVRRLAAATWAVYSAYAILGYFVVLRWHVVETDALARLSHAMAVWHNDPPKLAVIGFVWPPLMTLVLVPLSVVKPLAMSLAVLPLTSAAFAALLLLTLERTLALCDVGVRLRIALLVPIACNPMVAFYASNGMAESLYLALLTFAVYGFVRWARSGGVGPLTLSSIAIALGVLTRYELLLWAFGLAAGLVAVLRSRHARHEEIQGTLLAFLAPPLYALGLWVVLNGLIAGDPFFWVSAEVTQTFTETREFNAPIGWGEAASETLALSWELFPATFIAIPALLVLAWLRRDAVALTLAFLIALNPVTTAVLGVLTQAEIVFELRYNMRVIPLVSIGFGWVLLRARGRGRRVVAVGVLATLAVSAVASLSAMEDRTRTSQESGFLRALSSFSDQEGVYQPTLGKTLGVGPERDLGRWVRANIDRRNAVLVDDAKGFGVVLFSGRPDLFFDRTDAGDDLWRAALESPVGRVQYFLVSRATPDLIRARYPAVLGGGVPWLDPVYSNSRWKVYRVNAERAAP